MCNLAHALKKCELHEVLKMASPHCIVNSGCLVLSVSRFHSGTCGEGVRLVMKSKSSNAKEMSSVSITMDIKSSSFSSLDSLKVVLIGMVRVGSGYGSRRFPLVGRMSALGMSFCSAKEHVWVNLDVVCTRVVARSEQRHTPSGPILACWVVLCRHVHNSLSR